MAISLSLRYAFCTGILAVSAIAQGPGGEQSGAPPTTGGAPASNGSIPGGSNAPTQGGIPGLGRTPSQPGRGIEDIDSSLSRPIYISGKVATSDGGPLPSNISVQRQCVSASPQTVAYTDSKGHFNFQWDRPGGAVFADASESGLGNMGQMAGGMSSQGGFNNNRRSISNCEIMVNVPGYRSSPIQLFNHGPMDNPDIGTIVLHRIANMEGTSVSATSFAAPKDAKKSFDKGFQSLVKNKPEEAAKDLEKAVAAYPKYAEAWYHLGRARARLKQTDSAKEALQKSLEADPKLVGPWFELGLMAVATQNWEETQKYMDKTTHLDPIDFPQAWYILGVAEFNLGNLEAAEKSAREAQKLDSRHANPRTDYLLGMVLMERRDYSEAVTQLKSFLKASPNAPEANQVQAQVDEISKVIGVKGPGQ